MFGQSFEFDFDLLVWYLVLCYGNSAGYHEKLLEAQAAKGPRVAAYKRARRNKGLEKVEKLMQTRFECQLLPDSRLLGFYGGFELFWD